MEEQKLTIVFREKDIPIAGHYIFFPGSKLAGLKSSYGNQWEYPKKNKRILNDSLRSFFSQNESDLLKSHRNNLYFWFYLPLFEFLFLVRLFINEFGVKVIDVKGSDRFNCSAFSMRNDEVKGFFYFPAVIYPKYIKSSFNEQVKISNDNGLLLFILAFSLNKFRNLLIRAGKSLLLSYNFLVCSVMSLFVQSEHSHKICIVARSQLNSDFFKNVFATKGVTKTSLTFIVGGNLRKTPSIQRSGIAQGQRNCDEVPIYNFALFKQLSKKLFYKFNAPKQRLVRIEDGKNCIDEDLSALLKELSAFSIDSEFYGIALGEFFAINNIKHVFSNDIVSPYAHQVYKASKVSRAKCWIFQAFAFEVDDLIVPVPSDTFIVNTPSLASDYKSAFAADDIAAKYYGSIGFDAQPEKSHLSDFKSYDVVFFSQPYDYENSIKILKTLISIVGSDNVYLKLHPRDDCKNYSSIEGLLILDGTNLDNRTIMLNSDIVVSRTSSVLNEALLYGVPYISVRLLKAELKFDFIYLREDLGSNIYNTSAFYEIFANKIAFKKRFLENRKKLLTGFRSFRFFESELG